MVTLHSLCECSHTLNNHHNAIVCASDRFPEDTSRYCSENATVFPHAHGEECEHWGFNETGGLEPIGPNGEKLNWIEDPKSSFHNSFILDGRVDHWVDHCRGFHLAEN